MTAAPTEPEIREALRLRVELYPTDNPRNQLREAVEGYAAFLEGPGLHLHYPGRPPFDDPEDSDPSDVWMNLRPTEIKMLDAIAEKAIEEAITAAQAAIVEIMVAAGLRFAAEYPDAPRAKVAAAS